MVQGSDSFGLTIPRRTNRNFVVLLPHYLRDKAWANGMGNVQAAIMEMAQSDGLPTKRLVLDFTKCCWIDPLPLMSLLLEIVNARSLGITVEVRLPESDSGPTATEVGPYQRSPNRLLWFLNEEGFLDCLDSLADDDLVYLPKAGREAYRSLRVTPSYEDARCIPVTLFDVPVESDDGTFAQDSVERLLRGVDTKLDAKVAPQTRERLTYKLRVVLQEAIHNAQEHAYEPGGTPRLLAIYVRYRIGGIGLDSGGREVFNKHAQEEHSQCPGLDHEWLAARRGCLEVFVLDRGMGMVHSFELGNRPLTETYKFNQVMKETFLDGRSRKSERHTAYGGLHLLHNLLSDAGDFIRGLEEGTWFASAAPIIRVGKQTHTLTANQVRMRGLAMHYRLGWKAETDYGDKWATFSQGQNSEVWPELMLDEDQSASSFAWFDQQTVVDERFGDESITPKKSEWILWLVRQHRMKADILTFLERTVAPLVVKQAILIIADIPSYEAETYAAALAEYRTGHKNPWPWKFAHIILSTNRWRFAALDYETRSTSHGFSKLRDNFDDWKVASPKIDPKPKNFRLAIVRWLKWHDSNLFWKEISKRGSMFIPENVIWGAGDDGQNRIISGYLDFSRAARNPLCADIYRASLARVLGVLPANQVRMYPLDLLTMTVLRDIHTTEIYEPALTQPPTQLAVGSILVSGATLDASVTQGLDLHFFVHRSSPLRGAKSSLLFWLPPVEVKAGAPRLARIGKTATIAPDGWKSFEVPRFDADKKLVGGRDPRKTYEDWQGSNPVIVKAGHWSYQGHHDFLTVNIAGAVEAAFLEKNDLARFLVQRILPFIGMSSEHLKENCRRLLDSDQLESGDQSLPAEYGLLVYRSHPSTESVIRRLLETLTKEGRELASQRIFPILPVRMRWSGSTLLIPPLVREEIRAAIDQKGQPRAVLVFDDAAITGRTSHDLQAALSTIGAREVTTMVIANRLRQPSDGDGSMRLDYYWRLDVPVMGREGNCPLCHAIDLAKEFIGALASQDAKREVESWMRQWEDVSPIDNWNRGVRPLPLSNPELGKKYCCRLPLDPSCGEREYLTLIEVIRSTGLVINVSELHAMTGRDDYFLKKIGDHHEPEVRLELAASQLLLFGNEFDVDVRITLVQVLIRELARLKAGSPHAHLAGLATILGLSMLNGDAKLQAVKVVGDAGWTPRHNYSSRVLLAYLAKSELLDKKTEAFKIGSRLLSTVQLSLASRLRALFLETLSPLGNSHSEAIPSLLERLKGASQLDNESVQNALDSLEHLEDLILGLERSIVRKNARSEYETSMKDWKSRSEHAMKLLHQWRQAPESVVLGDVSVATENYLIAVKVVAGAYFHQIHSASDYYRHRDFETVILSNIIRNVDWEKASEGKFSSAGAPIENRRRVIQLSSAGDLDFDCNAGEIWITWYQGIPGILLDLMRNAVYASGQIADPWDPASEELADMWVRVDYRKEFVELTLANACSLDAKCLGSALKRHRWYHIAEIGGIVSPMPIKGNVMALRVRIPYAAYLSA